MALTEKTHRRNFMVEIFVLALAYFGFGRLGLTLAIPPGFATAIFPASGIALTALLLRGKVLWPGIFLGSVCINLWIAHDAGSGFSVLVFLIGLGIAFGSTVQALVGAILIEKFVEAPSRLDRERDILGFLFLGGPLSCLISASVALSVLLYSGAIDWTDAGFTWWTWWIGDTIGVLIVAPLVFVFHENKSKVWRKRRLSVVLPLLITIFGVVAIFVRASEWENQRIKGEFDSRAFHTYLALKADFARYQAVIASIERHFSASTHVSASDFKAFVGDVRQTYRGVQALGWNPRVRGEDLAAFEQHIREILYPDFTVTERDKDGNLVPVNPRPFHFPATYLTPLADNIKAVGFDIASNSARLEALTKAIDQARQTITDRIVLVQETGRQFGFLMFQPIYSAHVAPDTVETRRRNVRGLAVGVFRVGDMVDAVLDELRIPGMQLSIEDLDAPSGKRHLYGPEKTADTPTAALQWSSDVTIADRQWRIHLQESPQYMADHRAWQAWFVLAGGLLFVSLLQVLLLILTGRAARTERLVEERTSELAASEMRTRAIVDSALDGIITINEAGIVQSVNPAMEKIFGYHEHELVGHSVKKLTPSPYCIFDDISFAQALRQSAEYFVGHIREVEGHRRNGETFPVELQASEIRIADERQYLGVIRDISERKEVDRLKEEFVSTVSHELRTPLTSITGSLGLLIGGTLGDMPDKQKTLLNLANKNAERLIDLVNDILSLEKLASGRMEFDFQPLNIRHFIAQAIENNTGLAEKFGIRFDVVGTIPDVQVMADDSRLMQVMANLLSNAAKFSPEAGTVEISATLIDNHVRISVTDHGAGIPESFRDKIFSRFSQADGSDTKRTGGTGLGLNISKSIIDKHGGAIHFETTTGVGTTFHIELAQYRPVEDENV